MIVTPQNIKNGSAVSSVAASLECATDTPGEFILLTANYKGLSGNRISVEIHVNENPGVPTVTLDRQVIVFRIPSSPSFEASGPFQYDGSAVDGFGFMWFVGILNGKRSWALDGLPVTWPLTRDGEFMLHAEGSWHMIRRTSGVEIMHWQADTDVDDIDLIPLVEYGPENLDAWRGIAPLCTGYVDSHYGISIAELQYAQLLIDGLPEMFIPGNARVASMISASVPEGQNEYAKLKSSPPQKLSGGK